MPRPAPLAVVELRDTLRAELHKGNIHEADLRDPKWHLDGLCDGTKVYVNPAPAVVETLLHELLHRAKPRWGERRVLKESRRLLNYLTEREVRAWYRKFQVLAIRRKRPVKADE